LKEETIMRFPIRASLPRALFALALLAGALGPAGALSAQTPRVLRIATAEPTLGTSPLDGSTSASTRVWELMHDGLWDRDENFQPVPWLAASWDTSADATAWTFHLRDGLTFSDGSPITSADVQASFTYLATGKLWSERLKLISGIDTPDEKTAVIHFTRAVPEFLDLPLSNVQFSIFSKKAIDSGADWKKPMQVYSGPYMLKEYVPKGHLTLVKNPNYWRKDLPKFDEINWTFNEDPTAGVAAVESGAADVYSPVPAKDVPRLRTLSNVHIFEAQTPGFLGFGFDRSNPMFADQRVRNAIGLILDADERRDVCWFGTGGVLYGGYIFDYQPLWYNAITPWAMPRADRLAQAQQLLDSAGWVMGSSGQRVAQGITGIADGTPFQVDVPYEANWPASECHTQLLQNWGQQVGLTFNPLRYDPGRYWSDVTEGKFSMWHAGIPAAPYAPDSLAAIFRTGGAWNAYWFRGSDAELDAMFDQLQAEPDLARKKELLQAIEQRAADEQYMVADGSQSTLVLTSGEMQGFFARSDDSSRALILSDIPSR
jgi:peptide/nickel transport system substrate-binding protein